MGSKALVEKQARPAESSILSGTPFPQGRGKTVHYLFLIYLAYMFINSAAVRVRDAKEWECNAGAGAGGGGVSSCEKHHLCAWATVLSLFLETRLPRLGPWEGVYVV